MTTPTMPVSFERRDHVLHEGKIALGLRRDSEAEAPIAVVLGDVAAPLVQRERRVRDDAVEQHEPVAIPKLGVTDRVALLDPRVGQAMQEHVHLADGPRAQVLLLPEEGEVLGVLPVTLEVVGALDEHAA
jgi:hypothetical protein